MKKKTLNAPKKAKKETKKAPVALSHQGAVSAPSYSSKSDGSIRIRRTEFVATITNGSTTGFSIFPVCFNLPGLDFNPAIDAMFPWLSTVANSYERFTFHGLSFRLVPGQATSTPGRVYMAVDYDYDDPVAETKLRMMSNHTVAEKPVWDELRLVADSKLLHADMPEKYVSTATRMNFTEARTAYAGYLVIAFDTTATNLLFDLEVSYDVTLRIPVLEDPPMSSSTGSSSSAVSLALDTALCPTGISSGLYGREFLDFATQPTPAGMGAKTVQVGSNGVPTLKWGTSNAQPTKALDLADVDRRFGFISSLFSGANTSISPADPFAEGLTIDEVLFNSAGTYLGKMSAPAGGVVVDKMSGGSADTTVKGALIKLVSNLALESIFRAYPTARYMVPYITNSTVASPLIYNGGTPGGVWSNLKSWFTYAR